VEVARWDLLLGHFLAVHPAPAPQVAFGVPTTEPAFGLPARWVRPEAKTQAEQAGYTVVDLAIVLITHLTAVLQTHLAELLHLDAVRALLDHFSEAHPDVVDAVYTGLPLRIVQQVLRNLLREQLPIRDLLTILETLVASASRTQEPWLLTEDVRRALARVMSQRWRTADGAMAALLLSDDTEALLLDALDPTAPPATMVCDPYLAQCLLQALTPAVEAMAQAGETPLLLTSPLLRPHVQRVIEASLPTVVVRP
jgi:flagellar biosynthesis protein FlhA